MGGKEKNIKGYYYLAIYLILILPLSGCVTSPDINEKQTAVVTEAKTIKQASEKSGAIIAEEQTKEWELVSSFAKIRMVYMSPAGLKDKYYIAQILAHLVDKRDIIIVHFFDNKKYTPLNYPMTDKQMLHWKATYNFNPNNGYERFVFIEVTNSQISPPDLKEVEANIKPGYAP